MRNLFVFPQRWRPSLYLSLGAIKIEKCQSIMIKTTLSKQNGGQYGGIHGWKKLF